MDPSVSGDLWYPLECICRKMLVSFVVVWWLLSAVHRAVFEVRRIVLSAVCVKCEWSRGMFAYVGRSEDRSTLGER